MTILIHVMSAVAIAICSASIGAVIGGLFGYWLGKNYKINPRDIGEIQ